MAFRRTIARSLWAGKTAATAAVPKTPPPIIPARRALPAVEDCPTLAFLRPRPTTARYSTVSVPLPHHCFPAFPVGDQLFNRLVDGLTPPTAVTRVPAEAGVTLQEARKVARAAEMEVARATLRGNAQSVVSVSEYAALCVDIAGGVEGGRRLARTLDESGVVIVLADAVFLRPDMVAKAIGSILPAPARAVAALADDEARMRELEVMEEQKAAIDATAAAQVRRELWCGLGLLAAQTLGFMRLTFWELSWDVMEPICFYVTSIYFMSGYTFFMRTATEPSFEGFYRSRFASRQRRLMRDRRFDVARYNALKQAERSVPAGQSECDADVCTV
ncbi:calcium uniporter protein 2, mitochondrial-like [Lolium perenne]|uniref:calcium uniporter protein 2, mitochondrial-like n=1 Tax=Lolium perenne TaxID=4522 RepID=UPI0021EAD264|nr:calcium uniporter protein 2, mitochondrial-like [Lolium perenne]